VRSARARAPGPSSLNSCGADPNPSHHRRGSLVGVHNKVLEYQREPYFELHAGFHDASLESEANGDGPRYGFADKAINSDRRRPRAARPPASPMGPSRRLSVDAKLESDRRAARSPANSSSG
jgi:hypothetical protein